ncbi:glycosyltransferase family 1 protein [Rothia aerolata]|uniref:GTPase n=1 Tax=Rothia aerolata TaxID=1812262 RepID=A0A917IUH8_9MICC|nr:glycosyltransferase family 1 protein [Rothia aerolata]GGH62927.1 hypothetical protein GCM10007359_13680 [Rothia aerolata]
MKPQIDLFVAVPQEAGWAPVNSMTTLLANYLGVEPVLVDVHRSLSRSTKLLSALPRTSVGQRIALVIAYDPGQLNAIAQLRLAFKPYSAIYGWVIDSFWSERIPRLVRGRSPYTKIFLTDSGDLKDWEAAGVKNLGVLPWGTDVWSSFHQRIQASLTKTTDLLRVGRQPDVWNDDDLTASTARKFGLTFEGRPQFGSTPHDSARFLADALSRTKFTLAFSVRSSPTSYTHPQKDYITARWLDALAWGSTVVGQKPSSAATRELLWEGATIEISPNNREIGMQTIADVAKEYAPEQAREHVLMALQRLDWRHRFGVLLRQMNIISPSLNEDLRDIENALVTHGSASEKE